MNDFKVAIEYTAGSYGSSPLEGLADTLTQYFGKRIGYVADPWSQLAEGFLLKMHASKPDCHFTLTPADFGVDISKYGNAAEYMKAGRIDLMEASIRSQLDSLGVQWRQLPKKHGVALHWGLFVPLNAWPNIMADAADLRGKWDAALNEWITEYWVYRGNAEARVRVMAEQSWRNAQQLGADAIMTRAAWLDMAQWIDGVVSRAMDSYPERDKIRELYDLDYEQSIIPMPAVIEAEASWIEQVQFDKLARLEVAQRQLEIDKTIKEAEYISEWNKLSLVQQKAQARQALVQEYAEKTRQGLQQKKAEALRTFYAGYALQLRMRLYSSISLVVECLRAGEMGKKGRNITPQASGSLRSMVAELDAVRLDNDEEIEAMLAECRRLLGEPTKGEFTSANVGQAIEAMGVVLQTSILALGGVPKGPRKLKAEIDVLSELPQGKVEFAAELRRRRQVIGDFESVGEALIKGEHLGPSDLRKRRARFED